MPARKWKTADPFAMVREVGLALPDVEEVAKRGAPVLQMRGSFMAGLTVHPSAEPGSLIVRCEFEQRSLLIEDAPETYYITEYHARWPLALVRLSRIDRDALRDLLTVSWRMTSEKTNRRGGARRLATED